MTTLVKIVFLTLCLCQSSRPEVKDLNFVAFVPNTGRVWPGGRALVPALYMGLRDVNARADILPGYRLNVVLGDTKVE